ncbi:hypothetical protein [Thermus sp.]|uniref:hypothetical protein n=1 Tax=Thermus sp. TaxID=275 RepID=UPI00298EF797|nr:hypothetical protein [Thermus sp.]MDW8358604.1 hypothetical protein [Thermus sp.]
MPGRAVFLGHLKGLVLLPLLLHPLWGCQPGYLGGGSDLPFDAQLLVSHVRVPPGGRVELRVRLTPLYPSAEPIPFYSWLSWAHSSGCPREVIVTDCALGWGTLWGNERAEWDVVLDVQPGARPGTYRLALNYANGGTRKRLPFTLEVRP